MRLKMIISVALTAVAVAAIAGLAAAGAGDGEEAGTPQSHNAGDETAYLGLSLDEATKLAEGDDRPWRIARRLARMALRPDRRALHYAAAINSAYYGRTVRWKIRGRDPGRERSASSRRPRTAARASSPIRPA